jgi:Flp pilus assembly protein TadD
LSGLGYSLLDAGAPNEAAETFQKILAQSPNDAAAQVGLGEALLALDQPLAAATHLRKGLGSVGDARGFRALGVADDLLGQFQDAVADCERGLAATPNDPALRDDLGLSQILAGDVDGGLANLRAVASMPGAQARYRQNLALGLGLAGRAEEAERVARIDLDERSVASNLAYYATLRSLPPKDRAEAMLRPDRPPLAGTAIVK